MLKEFKVDLHIHTTLSPCGDASMIPELIVQMAKKQNLDVIGICDHNSSENVRAVVEAGREQGLCVIGGMEVTSQEEAHIIALFRDNDLLSEMQDIVYRNLPGINDEDAFGEQLIVDRQGRVISANSHLLIGATSLSVGVIVSLIHSLDGLAIASHVDKPVFSVTSQLGFIPSEVSFDALELSPNYKQILTEEKPTIPGGESQGPLVSFSDAHYLEDIGKSCTRVTMEYPSFEEVKSALSGIGGRGVGL